MANTLLFLCIQSVFLVKKDLKKFITNLGGAIVALPRDGIWESSSVEKVICRCGFDKGGCGFEKGGCVLAGCV